MADDLEELLDRAVDWYEPSDPDPRRARERTDRRARRRKTEAALLALTVFAGSTALLFSAFRNTRPHAPAGGQDEHFISLWPDRSVQLGASFDETLLGVAAAISEGDESLAWRESPTEVARRFASAVLRWPAVEAERMAKNGDGSIDVVIGQLVPCMTIDGSGGALGGQSPSTSTSCAVRKHVVTVSQPNVDGVRLWEVVRVRPESATEFNFGVSPGEVLTAGQTIRSDFGDVSPGAIGAVAGCSRPMDIVGTIDVDPNHAIGSLSVPHDLGATEQCDPALGYLYAYSATPPRSTDGDPFASASEIGEIALVPVVMEPGPTDGSVASPTY